MSLGFSKIASLHHLPMKGNPRLPPCETACRVFSNGRVKKDSRPLFILPTLFYLQVALFLKSMISGVDIDIYTKTCII